MYAGRLHTSRGNELAAVAGWPGHEEEIDLGGTTLQARLTAQGELLLKDKKAACSDRRRPFVCQRAALC